MIAKWILQLSERPGLDLNNNMKFSNKQFWLLRRKFKITITSLNNRSQNSWSKDILISSLDFMKKPVIDQSQFKKKTMNNRLIKICWAITLEDKVSKRNKTLILIKNSYFWMRSSKKRERRSGRIIIELG